MRTALLHASCALCLSVECIVCQSSLSSATYPIVDHSTFSLKNPPRSHLIILPPHFSSFTCVSTSQNDMDPYIPPAHPLNLPCPLHVSSFILSLYKHHHNYVYNILMFSHSSSIPLLAHIGNIFVYLAWAT